MDGQRALAVMGEEDRIIGSTGEAADDLKTTIDRRWETIRNGDGTSE